MILICVVDTKLNNESIERNFLPRFTFLFGFYKCEI